MKVLLLLPTLVLARDFAGDGPGPRPPRCDLARVNACVAQHQSAASAARAQIAEIDERLRILRRDQTELAQAAEPQSARISGIERELLLLEAERRFLRNADAARSAGVPPHPQFSSLEDYFRLPARVRRWEERHPREREERLSARLNEATREKLMWTAAAEENSREFARLSNEIQALQNARTPHENQASAHDAMCRNGCRDELCAGEN